MSWCGTRKSSERLTLFSPIKGTVTEKMVVQKAMVKPGEMLYRLANLESVWVYLDIYEYELPWVQYGQMAEIKSEALSRRDVSGPRLVHQPGAERGNAHGESAAQHQQYRAEAEARHVCQRGDSRRASGGWQARAHRRRRSVELSDAPAGGAAGGRRVPGLQNGAGADSRHAGECHAGRRPDSFSLCR